MNLTALPDVITSPDAADFNLVIENRINTSDTYIIRVLTGTWKFNVFGATSASNASYTNADGDITITIKDKITCKADAVSRTFRIIA